jgi:hypothetical protein
VPLDRYEAHVRRRAPAPPPADGADAPAAYRLASTVPDYWVPLLPVRPDADDPSIRLRRGRVLVDRGGEPVLPPVLGRVLAPDGPLELFEEEVPRAGARVLRSFQQARWLDGETHLWLGRRKTPGRGEGSSGLRFDIVE